MHDWSEKDFDWKGLNEAVDLIAQILHRGRVPVRDAKEKWGTVRIYCSFGWNQFHDIFWPRYAFNQYPYKWLWLLDCRIGPFVMTALNKVVVPIHERLYRYSYKKAVEKYPHLRQEILSAADFDELLKGL
jgi:hypothetical protein